MRTALLTFMLCVTLGIHAFAQCFVQLQKTNESCCGACDGTAQAFVSGGTPPYMYSWSGGQSTSSVTGLCQGTYTVVVVDAMGNFCTASTTITGPFSTYTTTPTNASCSTCCDGSATVNVAGGSPPYTYSWAPGGQTTQTVTGLCPGTYTVCATDQNGRCCCAPVTISFATGQAELNIGLFQVQPNPSSGLFTIIAETELSQVSIYNTLGEKIREVSLTGKEAEIDLSDCPKGVYLVHVRTGEQLAIRKIVLN
ncbi:MAG: T9SS type A sorting domain-containing protein [Bacteroidota bacterium]